jgi:ABC-type antimicrobial peptide transport system permease subunit
MRNAALVLGLIGGVLALFVGFFGFGYTEFVDQHGEIGNLARQVDHPMVIRAASFMAPILAIAGAAMARSANIAGGVLMLAASLGLYMAFGFNVFTMFPEAMCALGGILALAARQPDPH